MGFGLPITVADFRPEIESDLARGIRAVNHQIYQGIEAEMVHVPEKNMDEVADIALAIGRAEKQYPLFRFRYVNEGRLDHEQHVLANFIERDSPEIREKLQEMRGLGLPVPSDLEALEQRLEAEFAGRVPSAG